MPLLIVLILIVGIVLGLITVFIYKTILNPGKLSTVDLLLKQGKIAAATKLAKQIISKDSRNTEAHFLLGLAYIADNKPQLALVEMKTVNNIGNFGGFCPEATFRSKMGELYETFDQPDEALKEYLLLIRQQPAEAEHYLKAGNLFEKRNKAAKAVQYYRKAIQLNPRLGQAHFKLGYILYRGKKHLEAKEEFEKTIQYEPGNYSAHFYLAKILKDGHEYIPALLSFEKATRDPELKVKALVERGSCYLQMKSFDKAIVELERAIKLATNPASPETLYARYFLAVCHEQERNIEKAIEQWEIIYSKKPGFRDVAEKLSQYQEMRTDDRVKDYLTAAEDDFQEICKAITESQKLSATDVSSIRNGCQIIAVEDSSKWRGTRKMPKLMWFLRVPEIINESTVRSLHEKMKALSVTRGYLIVSSTFSRKAIEYAESRPIDLINKDKLQEILKTTNFPDFSKLHPKKGRKP